MKSAFFCRSNEQIERITRIAELAGIKTVSSIGVRNRSDAALIETMHLAKGLEFKVVLIVACDEGVLPLASRVADVADEFELDEAIMCRPGCGSISRSVHRPPE